MKKLFCLLLALPLMFLASCNDDDKVPQFDVKVVFGEGVTVDNNVITVEQGQPVSIESVSPVNSNAKEIAFGPVTYQLDYGTGLTVNVQPYAMTFETATLPVGTHRLNMTFPVYAVGYSVARSVVSYELVVTEPSETPDAPSNGGEYVVTPHVSAD